MSTVMSEITINFFELQQIERGKRLKSARIEAGLGLLEFAARVGVHRNTQRNYENGTRVLSAEYCKAIATLGIDVQYIFSGVTVTDSPARAKKIAELVSTKRDIGIEPNAMGALIYLLSSSDVSEVIPDNEEALTENQIDDLIKIAFERSEVFYEAYRATDFYFLEAIFKYHYNCRLWCDLIFETVRFYDEIRDVLPLSIPKISIHDGVRIAAEGVERRRNVQKGIE
jgi:transcriptional regulator with XRE-family HTH domain